MGSMGQLWLMNFPVHVGQIILMAAVVSVGLILGKHKLALLGVYILLFYWVFFSNRFYLSGKFEESSGGLLAYGALALVAVLLGVVGVLRKADD